MSDLAYTNSMMNEIRELLKTARQRVAVQVNTERFLPTGILVGLSWNMNSRVKIAPNMENSS